MDKTTEKRRRLGITLAYRASHPSRRLNCQALFHPVGGIAHQGTDAGQFCGAQALLVLGCGGGRGGLGSLGGHRRGNPKSVWSRRREGTLNK